MLKTVGRFLRASWDRSADSVGRVDLLIGAILTLIGRAMNVDLALLAVAVLLLVLLIRVFVLSPAAMWSEAEAERKRPPQTHQVVGSVEAGGIVNINYYGPGEFSASSNSSLQTGGNSDQQVGQAQGTITVDGHPVSSAEPRSRRKSRHDRPHPPP